MSASAIETAASFDIFAGDKALLLTTFRKDGTAVPTAVCTVVEDGVVYLVTVDGSAKVRRIRNDPRVTLGTCTMRKGIPTGPSYAARARVLTPEEIRRTKTLRETRFVGAVFTWPARAHWLVKPFQLFERAWYRHRFVAVAVEPSPVVDVPGECYPEANPSLSFARQPAA